MLLGQSLTLIGAAVIAYGCWLWSHPLGLIVAGVFLSIGGAVQYRNAGNNSPGK